MEFSLSRLPDDICCSILSELDVARCLICCSSEVAKSWRVAAGRHLIWRGIARLWGLTLPALSRRNTRATDDLKVTLFTSWRKRNSRKADEGPFSVGIAALAQAKGQHPAAEEAHEEMDGFSKGTSPLHTVTARQP